MKKLRRLVVLPLFLVAFILKTISVDLVLNLQKAFIYSFNPEERKKIKRELELNKLVELMNERLKGVERLLYSVLEDAEYLKSDGGKSDLKELKKEVK